MTLEENFKKYETSYRQYYGKDYDKALNNLRTTKKKTIKRRIKKKYPNAHLDRFSFNVVLSKTGDVTETSVSFKVLDEQFLDITTKDFKNLYSGELYWLPTLKKLFQKISRQNVFGLKNLNVRVQILTIGIRTMRTNIIFEIISTE